jgi:hypothetical protein
MGNDPQGGLPPANEPFDGYSEADIETIELVIDDVPEGPEREALKAAIRDAEYAREVGPRKGVLAATEPKPITPPPAPTPGDPEPGDTSGRPNLCDVAEQRAANTRERVITTQEEK